MSTLVIIVGLSAYVTVCALGLWAMFASDRGQRCEHQIERLKSRLAELEKARRETRTQHTHALETKKWRPEP